MNNKINRVSLTARVVPTLKKALETESREHGQTTSNYVETILLKRGEAVSDNLPVVADMQQQLELLQAKNEKLEEQLETYIPEDTLLKEQENVLYREQQYQVRIDELTKHVERLSVNPENTISNEVYDKIAFEKSSLESNNQALQAQVDDLTEELQSARQVHQEKDDLRIKFLQLQETEKFLRMNNTDLQEEVQKLTREVEITEEALDEVTELNQTLVQSHDTRVVELTDELSKFTELGYSVEEIQLLEEANNELHNRVDTLEMQLIEAQQSHEAAIQELEEEETVNPDYMRELQNTVDGHNEQISNLEEELAAFEGKILLDLTPEQIDKINGYFEQLRQVYDGRSDEELVMGALYCGVENERAFFRKLLSNYFD